MATKKKENVEKSLASKSPKAKVTKVKPQAKLEAEVSRRKAPRTRKVLSIAKKPFNPAIRRTKGLMARRPHRSFRLTRRRDTKRSLKMPGYWSFTGLVFSTLWKNKKLFGALAFTYVIITIVVSGFAAQSTYSSLSDSLKQSGGDLFSGNFGAVAQAGLLLLGTVTSSGSSNLTDSQYVIGGLAVFYAWLTSIWLLRNTLAGHKPKLRDGLYNSGSPVLATIVVAFIITLQALPAAIATIVYENASASGFLDSGVTNMLITAAAILLIILSLYWLTTSFIALVIVTLPGMYPMQAIRTAGDLAVGRRLRILFRLVWLALSIAITWAVIVIPIILFDDWIKKLLPIINWLPLVPVVIVVLSSLSLIYVTSYIYLLYRRIVDDDAAPA